MPRLPLLLVAMIGLSGVAKAQTTYGAIQNYCTMGGVSAMTQGSPSTNRLQGIIPSCTVTVYQTGTQTLATIYSSNTGTALANPFTSTAVNGVAPGSWIFWVPQGTAGYDIVLSGGVPPNVYTHPVTLVDVTLGGGGGSSPPNYSVQFALSNGTFGSDPNITINPNVHSLNVAGSGTGSIALGGAGSGQYVTQTVNTGTGAYTYVWPIAAPTAGTGTNCLTVQPPNMGNTVGTFLPCTNLVYDIRTYGAVSGQDETAAVQAALNAAIAVGGIVYFPVGIWPINGPINSACDAIICLPAIPNTQASRQVKIAGVTRNRQDSAGPTNLTGSLITTTTTGDAQSSVFGVPSVTTPFGNNLDAYFSDLTIRTYPNPQIGCINTYNAAGAWIDGVRCEVGENYVGGSHTQPTNTATGITLPATGNDTLAGLTRSEITGYYQGVNFSEHAYFNDVWVAFGIQGYFAEPGFNPVTGHMGCEEVGVCLVTLGGDQLDIDLAIELDPSNVFGCVTWCYSTTDVLDDNNKFRGWVNYYKSVANVGNVTTPIAVNDGGAPGPAATFYNLYTTALTKILAPIFTSTGTLPTCTGGAGVSACVMTAGSTEARGTMTLTMSGVTTDSPLATLNFGAELFGSPWCQAWQAGGAAWYGVDVEGSADANHFAIDNTVSLTGVTSLVVGYACEL